MPTPQRLRQILGEYKQALAGVLGEDLHAVILYGSQARGDAEEGSDIDVLCVMKSPFDYGELIVRTSGVSAAISLRHDVVISTAFVALAHYERRKTPFLMNVRREGVAV